MGFLEARKARAEAEASERAARELAEERAARSADIERLRDLIESARTYRGFGANELPERTPLALSKGERVFVVMQGAMLIEPRSAGGHWEGRSQGVSVRIPGTRSARYRVGANKGHYVRAPETPAIIDTGTATVTDKRVAFAGPKQSREWQWGKCLGMSHQEGAAWTTIAVSNRQKASGIGYDGEHAEDVRFRLDLAFAVATEATARLVSDLEADLRELTGPEPLPAPHPQALVLPPGWHADPSGRHEARYWDGTVWTTHVADNGIQNSDPVA